MLENIPHTERREDRTKVITSNTTLIVRGFAYRGGPACLAILLFSAAWSNKCFSVTEGKTRMYTVLAFLNIRWERGRRETRKREVGMLVDGPTDHTLQNLCSKLLSEKLLHSNPLSYTGVHLHSLHNTLNLDFDSDLSQRPPFHSHRN